MSRTGEITLQFGDRERTFKLGIRQLEKIDEQLKVGPAEIARRLAPAVQLLESGVTVRQALMLPTGLGSWRTQDVTIPIYQGLLGGDLDLSPHVAGQLLRDNVLERPLLESVGIAYALCVACLAYDPDDPVGESTGAEAKAPQTPQNPSQTDGSGSAPSTASAPPSGGRRRKPAKPVSGS